MKNIFDRLSARNSDSDSDEYPKTDASQVSPHSSSNPTADRSDSSVGPQTARDVKSAVQELLKQGSIDEATRAEVFRHLMVHQTAIQAVLEPLDLTLRLDTHRGIAFLSVANATSDATSNEAGADDAWSHPLVRRQRLTLEQTLLIAILRQAFVIHEQEVGVGLSPAKIAVDDLLPQFLTYVGDSGSDNKNESRLLSLLDQLKSYGVVSEVDKQHDVIIRPLIAHMANPESLSALLQMLQKQSTTTRPTPDRGLESHVREEGENE
jgi:hypothetical protein